MDICSFALLAQVSNSLSLQQELNVLWLQQDWLPHVNQRDYMGVGMCCLCAVPQSINGAHPSCKPSQFLPGPLVGFASTESSPCVMPFSAILVTQ